MVTAPDGGIRIGKSRLRAGQQLPHRYARQLEASWRPRDPATHVAAAPPNYGRDVVPHVMTFRGLLTTLSRAYRYSDEALRHSVENAHMMLNDPMVAGPVFSRQLAVSLLNWSIVPEDEKDPQLLQVAGELQHIVEQTPRFTEYRRCLLEAIFYGRYATQHAFGFNKGWNRPRRLQLAKWTPLSGDKLLFRYNDGSGEFDADQVGVRVSAALVRDDKIAGKRELEPTSDGLGMFFERWERDRFAIHKHMVRDGEFEDPHSGAQIHGVGIRHWIYWTWYQKQETLAQLVEIVERTGNGFTIYTYPEGNEQARLEVEKIAKNQAHTNVIIMPFNAASPDDYQIINIPPNTQGVEALKSLIDDYYGDMLTRFILGQTLSTKPASTGLGSGVADFQQTSLANIVQYDAVNLEETLTTDLVDILRDANFPRFRGARFFFRINTKAELNATQMEAIQRAYMMGLPIVQGDVYDVLGLRSPDVDDETLVNPQLEQARQQVKQMEEQDAAAGMALPEFDTGGAPAPPEHLGALRSPAVGSGMPGDVEPDTMEQPDDIRSIFGPVLNRMRGCPIRYDRGPLRKAVAEAARQTERRPSDAQLRSGNFRKGKFWWNGWQISIEHPKGSTRRFPGKDYTRQMHAHYGYLRRTLGRDADQLDVYVGPAPERETVYVVDQCRKSGRFDEHKVLLGFDSQADAKACYLSHYPSGWKCGNVSSLTIPQFRAWLDKGDHRKPIAGQVSRYARKSSPGQLGLFDEESHPRGAAGSGKGGQFVAKGEGGGGTTTTAPAPPKPRPQQPTPPGDGGRKPPAAPKPAGWTPSVYSAPEWTDRGYAPAVYAAMEAAWDDGRPVTMATRMRQTTVRPEHRAAVRLTPGGDLQLHQGKQGWVSYIGETLDAIGSQLGVARPSIPTDDVDVDALYDELGPWEQQFLDAKQAGHKGLEEEARAAMLPIQRAINEAEGEIIYPEAAEADDDDGTQEVVDRHFAGDHDAYEHALGKWRNEQIDQTGDVGTIEEFHRSLDESGSGETQIPMDADTGEIGQAEFTKAPWQKTAEQWKFQPEHVDLIDKAIAAGWEVDTSQSGRKVELFKEGVGHLWTWNSGSVSIHNPQWQGPGPAGTFDLNNPDQRRKVQQFLGIGGEISRDKIQPKTKSSPAAGKLFWMEGEQKDLFAKGERCPGDCPGCEYCEPERYQHKRPSDERHGETEPGAGAWTPGTNPPGSPCRYGEWDALGSAMDAMREWDEDKHPRGQGGKFSSKGGGASSGGGSAKPHEVPAGVTVGKWTKNGPNQWSNEQGREINDSQMEWQASPEDMAAAVDQWAQQQQDKPDPSAGVTKQEAEQGANSGFYDPQAGKSAENQAATADAGSEAEPQEKPHPPPAPAPPAEISQVAEMFGLRPGDVLDNRRAGNFVHLAARNLGHNPQGKTREAQVADAAQFLTTQKPHLDAMVSIAQTHGYKGKAKSLVTRASNAADFVLQTAVTDGFKPQGRDPREDLAGALAHLHGQKPSDEPAQPDLLGALGKAGVTWAHVAGALVGFWLVSQLMGGSGGGGIDPLSVLRRV